MAMVKAPFFSTWASGSVGKVVTVRWVAGGNRFVFAKHKSRAGKRYDIQIHNAKVFAERNKAMRRALKAEI